MDNNLTRWIDEVYLNATFPILNNLRKLIVEVHHIGSTTFNNAGKELDILFVFKKDIDMFDYVEILSADGYFLKSDMSPYFHNLLVMTNTINDCIVNYIFMNERDIRVKEILDLSLVMKKSKVLQNELVYLKEKTKINGPIEYTEKKFNFFNEVKDIMLKGTVI